MIKQLTKREKILIALTGVGFFAYLLITLVINPIVSEWQKTDLEHTTQQLKYVKTLNVVLNVPITGNVKTDAPTPELNSTRISEFLREIEKAAGQRVVIRRFQPLRNQSEQSQNMKKNQESIKISKIQVQIECLGLLKDLLAFFDRLEKQDGLTRIRHFYLTPEGNGQDRLLCQIVIVRMLAV